METPPPPQNPIPNPGDHGQYQRPVYGMEPFQADKVVGIIMIVLAALGACGSLMVMGLGGLVGAAGVSTRGEGAGVAAAAGGFVVFMGIIWLAICVVEIFLATWIMKSLRKGFMIVLILGAIGLLINIVSMNFIGIVLGLIFPGYAAMRLYGNYGPPPLAG